MLDDDAKPKAEALANEVSDSVAEETEILRELDLFHHTEVRRRGRAVIKETGPWAATVRSLLRHLENVDFGWSPRLLDAEAEACERESITYEYVEGVIMNPAPWSDENAVTIGRLVRELHEATASYYPLAGAVWKPWFGRSLGRAKMVIGHCDVAPWNIVSREGRPVALIDWEVAGPVDPLVDLAQACWLNVRLFDDLVAEREGLPSLAERARQLHVMVDAYGLSRRERRGFVATIIEFAVHYTAYQADDAEVTPESTDPAIIWALAWPARSAAWMLRNRRVLERALT